MFNSFLFQFSFSYFLGGIFFAFLAFFVYIKASQEPLNRAFAAYCLSVAWWCIFSIPMINSHSQTMALFWDKICLIGVAFIPSTFIHFNYIFLGYAQKYRWFIILNYFITLLTLIANCTPYFVSQTSPKFGLNFYTDAGLLYLPFVVYFFALTMLTIFALYLGQRKAQAPRKKQILLIFWSSLLGYSLGGLNYYPSFNIGPAFLPLIGNIGVTVYAVIFAYTITKHHLMDISVVISRAVAEILVITVQGATYMILIWLYVNHVSSNIEPIFIILTVIYGIFVGQTHHSLRLYFQTTAEKVFVRGKYNYYQSIAEASSKVGEKLSLSHILKIIYSTFDDTIEIHNSRVFLPEFFTDPQKESQRYLVFDKTNFQPIKNGEQITTNDSIVAELIAKRKPILHSTLKDTVLLVPCLLENRLIGFFALGNKLSEDRYTNEDLRLLEVLASQAAVTLDHTRSYEKIALDLEAAQFQLERSQRLASIGTLTAGVTHEIRNPLTVIRAETERLPNQPRDQEYLTNFKDLLFKHISRIENVVQRMLGLAREKPRQDIDININEQLDSILSFFRFNNIVVEKELGPINSIKADPQEVQEVFVNLVQNAIEAMSAGGKLKIRTFMQNDRINVEISDTGKGIPAEIKERIFDPFYSTRHEGVGLGLSIVYRIVRQCGGDIKVISEVGKGSTFKLVF